jgi:hypothetical protein
MTNDIVQRLREVCRSDEACLTCRAADHIEQLEAEVGRLNGLLGSGYNTDLDHWRKKYAEQHDRAEAAEAKVTTLREAIIHLRAYVRLWTDDVAANLKPTPESLLEAGNLATKALEGK